MNIGIHCPVQGATQRFHDTAAALSAAAYLWLPSEQPSDAAPYPAAQHFVRLDNWRVGEGPLPYCARVEPTVTAWRNVPNVVFVLGNEPDLEAGHNGEDFPLFASTFRARFTNTRVANPPLSVEATHLLTPAMCDDADVVACHAYVDYRHPDTLTNPNLGQAYRHALAAANGKPVAVTEMGVSNFDGGNWTARNLTIARWITAAAADGVAAVCLFIADGLGTEWAAFDVGPEAATEIRAFLTPVPQPTPPPSTDSPYTFDGDYSYATFQAMVAGPLANKNPSVASRANYRAVHLAAEDLDISIATLIGWIKSENVDPDLIAINNLGGIKYVGQSRAYQSDVYPPANEGGVYAGFRTLNDFWVTLGVNITTILPDAWAAGDLRAIARLYTGGSWGESKVALVDALRDPSTYPHGSFEDDSPTPAQHYQIVTPVDCPVVQGSDGTFSHGGNVPGFFAIDYGCARGTPVRAAADGTVGVIYTTDWNPVSARTGPSVWIDHACGYSTFSCHLSRIDVATSGHVTQGQIIGLSGDPAIDGGYGEGAHLHWEIWDTAAHVRVKMEDLEAAGIAGPWSETEIDKWETAPMIGDGFSDEEILLLVFGTRTPSQAAKKKIGWNPTFGIPTAYKALANGQFKTAKQDLTGKSIVLGRALTREEPDVGTPGRSVQWFEAGKLSAYKQADGSYLIVVN